MDLWCLQVFFLGIFLPVFAETSGSLITTGALLRKVHCPRLIFPASNLLVALVDFTVSFCLLVLMMVWYRIVPSWQIIFFPVFIMMCASTAIGLGLIAATFNAKFRDFQQLIPFLLQMGMYISPVGYLNQLVPKKWEVIYSLNPLAGIINGFRWTLVPESIPVFIPGVIYSAVFSILALVVGVKVFRAAEANFADTI